MRKPCSKPAERADSPWPLEQKPGAAEGAHFPLRPPAAPGPARRCAVSRRSRKGLRNRTQERALAGNWRTTSLQAQGVAQLPAGARPEPDPARQQAWPTPSWPLMATGPCSAQRTRPALGYAACLDRMDAARALEQRHSAPTGPGAATGRPGGCLQLFVRGILPGSAGGEEPWPAVVEPAAGARAPGGPRRLRQPLSLANLQPLLPADLPAATARVRCLSAQAILPRAPSDWAQAASKAFPTD